MATMSVIFLLLSAFLSWTNSKLMSSQNKTEICVVSFHLSPINPWTSHDKLWTHVKFIPNIKLMKCLWKFKTWWISTFSPTKWVYVEYCPFIVKMHVKVPWVIMLWGIWMQCVRLNWFWGYMTLYHYLNVCIFIKITQGKNIFVCDSMDNIKLTQHEFYMLYCDSHTIVDDPTFENFNAIKNNLTIPFPWVGFFYLNGGKMCVFGIFICWT